MSVLRLSQGPSRIIYPDSDGEPMADNPLRFQWIVTIKEGLEAAFADRPDIFVAGESPRWPGGRVRCSVSSSIYQGQTW
jgi:hypothetical protein